jgi:hypothetical protein
LLLLFILPKQQRLRQAHYRKCLTSLHRDDCLGTKAPVIAVSTAIHAGCECDEAQIHFSF